MHHRQLIRRRGAATRVIRALTTLLCANLAIRSTRTLLHGAFQWLQPRSPAVHEVVERGRGPDPLDARVEVASRAAARVADASPAHAEAAARASVAAAGGNARAAGRVAEASRHRAARADGNRPPGARAADVSLLPASPVEAGRAAADVRAAVRDVVARSPR